MGLLTLPSTGLVYVDTAILIYSAEKHSEYAPVLLPLWQSVSKGEIEAISSELTILETLVGPMKRGDDNLVADYERLFQQPGLRLLPISQPILREASRLRAAIPGLRTPDAIHAATGLLFDCSLFITNDKDFRSVPDLPTAILSDLEN